MCGLQPHYKTASLDKKKDNYSRVYILEILA